MPKATLPFCNEIRVSRVECRGEETCCAGLLFSISYDDCPCLRSNKKRRDTAHSRRFARFDDREAYEVRRLPPLSVVFVFVAP